MVNKIEQELVKLSRPYITDGELEALWKGTANSRYSKIKRLLAQNKLLHIRRGLYVPTEKLNYFLKPHPFELAQMIYGPSYISFESAMSFHQLIPEAVYTITNASIKRAKEFSTPLGLFSYLRLPSENFFCQVELIQQDNYRFLMARPWKAICDYIYCNSNHEANFNLLCEKLRIDKDLLPLLSVADVELLEEYYDSKQIKLFFKSFNKELLQK